MKVIYEKTIVQKITQEARDAMIARKRIEKILLTGAECDQLKYEFNAMTFDSGYLTASWLTPGMLPAGMKCCGLTIERDPNN